MFEAKYMRKNTMVDRPVEIRTCMPVCVSQSKKLAAESLLVDSDL